MREIKFRAWENIIGKMWTGGINLNTNDDKGVISVDLLWDDYSYRIRFIDTSDVILMQYTGLKDKNEKEIYEGDIVTYTAQFEEGLQELNCVVTWVNELAAYYLVRNTADLLHAVGNDIIEIIGNIYENPELLAPNPNHKGGNSE